MNIIEIYGITIHEPVATLTDLLVSVACLYSYNQIRKQKNTDRTFVFFKYYFLIMAIATFLGGLLGHAFLYALSFAWKLPGWITSMFSIMFVERATIEHAKTELNPKLIQSLRILNTLELLLFLGLTLYTLDFFFVEFHSGYGLMFVVLSLQGYLYYKNRNKASLTILFAVGIAAIAALVFMNQISLHQWFNHLSISHTLMAISAFIFGKGVLKIKEF